MNEKGEAFKAAIQLERDGRAFYLETAAKASNEITRRMFESLAGDELRHIEWIEALVPGVENARTANEALYARLKGIFAGVPAEVREGAGLAQDDLQAIDVAIRMEDKSAAAYTEWVEKGETEDIRSLGKVLVGQERFHRQLLENAKEYLRAPGDWFMQEEQWSFDGG